MCVYTYVPIYIYREREREIEREREKERDINIDPLWGQLVAWPFLLPFVRARKALQPDPDRGNRGYWFSEHRLRRPKRIAKTTTETYEICEFEEWGSEQVNINFAYMFDYCIFC